MLKKNIFGFVFLILGISFILSGNFTITGGVINSNFQFSFAQIFGLIFIVGAFLIFATRHTLDVIIIPTGPSHEEGVERAKRAEKEYEKNKGSYFIISGTLGDEKLSESQTADIYRELRKHGVRPSQMSIESRSRNTIENMMNSLEEIKQRGGKEVGIASYPGHLDRFEDIFERAKKKGIIDDEFHLHRLPTKTRKNQTHRERLYETLAWILHRYKLRHGIKEALKSEDDPFVKYLKKAGSYVLHPIENMKKLFS